MNQISDKTLNIITDQHLHPKPRWQFITKNAAIWSLLASVLVVEGILVSEVVFFLTEHDFDIHDRLQMSLVQYTLVVLPYFWLIISLLGLGLIVYNFRQTKRGYRFQTYFIVLGSVTLGVVLGSLFYYVGLGGQIDDTLAEKVPVYKHMVCRKSNIWMRPEDGLLAGEIVEVRSPEEFLLRDLDWMEWTMRGEQIIWQNSLEPRPRLKIKVIGEQIGHQVFTVFEVRRWTR